MKYITVPGSITLVDQDGDVIPDAPVRGFYKFINDFPLNDKIFGQNFKAIMIGGRIQSALQDAEQGDVVPLEDADYDLLKVSIDTPSSQGLPPLILRQYLPFMASVMDASDKAVKVVADS